MAVDFFQYLIDQFFENECSMASFGAYPVPLAAYVMGLGTGDNGCVSPGFCGFSLLFVSGGFWCLHGRVVAQASWGSPVPCGYGYGSARGVTWKFPHPAACQTCVEKKRMQ